MQERVLQRVIDLSICVWMPQDLIPKPLHDETLQEVEEVSNHTSMFMFSQKGCLCLEQCFL